MTRSNISVIDKAYTKDKKIKNHINFKELNKLLFKLYFDNEILSFELGKLPEFQDPITNQEIQALKRLMTTYNNYPLKFNYAFNQMNQIGISSVRRFNSPLQALFWLYSDGYIEEAEANILDYNLKDLLCSAWLLKHTVHLNRWKWRTEGAKKLFNSCIDYELREKIKNFYRENKGATDYIISLYEQYPNSFTYTFKPFESELYKQNNRWDVFEEVVDRVNSPELVHYYIMSEYSYSFKVQRNPKSIFQSKSGDSDSIARFGEFLLKKNGYKTFIKRVKVLDSLCATKHTGAGIVLDNGTYLLVIDFPKGKSIAGPFDVSTLEEVLSHNHCLYPHEMLDEIPRNNELINREILLDPI